MVAPGGPHEEVMTRLGTETARGAVVARVWCVHTKAMRQPTSDNDAAQSQPAGCAEAPPAAEMFAWEEMYVYRGQ